MNSFYTGTARAPVTRLGFLHHASPGTSCPLGGAVGAPIVHYDNFIDILARNSAYDVGDRLFFIECWDND
jgi:hypothetical protein